VTARSFTARSFGDIAAGLVRAGDPDRDREKVWRHSYDVDSPEGRPWVYVLDRSREAWRVVKNALARTCREDVNLQAREARGARYALQQDLHELERARARGQHAAMPAIQQRIDAKRRQLQHRLRVGDDRVLEAYLDDYNPETGELFTAQATIAAELGLGSASSVNTALQRLRRHGYLDWVRRSRITECEGPGWKRKQASCGYFFDWKRLMPPRTWSRFWQLVTAGLKKAGKDAVAKTAALFTRVVAARLLGRPRSSPPPGPRLRTRLRRDSLSRIYPSTEL
jgi:hypothetical protein